MPNNSIHSDAYLEWFNKIGHKIPDHFPHGTEEEIAQNMKPAEATNWRMEGVGSLVADTPMGKLVQNIGPDYICTGTDKNGKPILKKIKL